MADTRYTMEEVFAMRESGMNNRQIGEFTGLNDRTINRKIARMVRRTSIPPLAEAVPEGFEITKIASSLDKDGKVQKQFVQSRPEGEEQDDSELVPAGHAIKGMSTLLDESGKVRLKWVKTSRDADLAQMAQQAALAEMVKSIAPLPPIDMANAVRSIIDRELLSQYTMTDCHVGMLAWGRETHAEPWDLEIAEHVLVDTFARMIATAPASAEAILNQLGDFLHFDSLSAVTPSSGHILDADSRYQKVVQVAVRILIKIIDLLLQKHSFVTVYMHEGNHDMAGSVWLRVMFAELFKNNPRVRVELNPNPYQAFQHGKTMLAYHHGHLAKKVKLPQVFAAQYAQMWGATEHRYIHTGHLHNEEQIEYPGVKLLQHPTLASPDAYAARNGWLSKRQAMRIDYSSIDGEVGRAIFIPK